MLETAFSKVYTKFKLHFYRAVFGRFQAREATLTTVETFCMETIAALGEPTANEFSSFVGISPPNAAYKINNLVQKGYVEKRQSHCELAHAPSVDKCRGTWYHRDRKREPAGKTAGPSYETTL